MLERRVKSDYSLKQLPSAAGGRAPLLPPHLPGLAALHLIFLFFPFLFVGPSVCFTALYNGATSQVSG